jgi:16S rRNA (guanine1516-N2)-methyltransferase
MTITIDFTSSQFTSRLRQGLGVREPLARALGIKSGKPLRIIDATAGLGRDAFLMAYLGCTVTLLERSPAVFQALSQALQHASVNPHFTELMSRMILKQADSIDYLSALHSTDKKIDAIYLDPMYPSSNKSALVKKEMRDLREIVGDDPDVEKLFEAAMQAPVQRVVVKRHRHAPPILERAPSHMILTKLLRFDVYILST